jgi:hypothetical protein
VNDTTLRALVVGAGLLTATSVFATGDSAKFEATSLTRNDGSATIELSRLSTFEGNIASPETTLCDDLGGVDEVAIQGGAEIVAHDAYTQRLFVTHDEVKQVACEDGSEFEERIFRGIDFVDIANPQHPRRVKSVDVSALGRPTSVAVCKNRRFVAAAIAADPLFQEGSSGELEAVNGVVAFFNKRTGRHINTVEVGALPDMITCTPDGNTLLVANEAEPERDAYEVDPPGSVSVIDVSHGPRSAEVYTAGFEDFNDKKDELIAQGVRIFGPNASVAQDVEPEYIAVDSYSEVAWITLQENNAVAKLDISSKTITDILPLGYKDHALLIIPEDSPTGRAIHNGLDPSDRDGGRIIRPEPVSGMYQPDAIAAFQVAGQVYFATANEGDSRDYDSFSEEFRIKDFPDEEEGLPEICLDEFPEDIQDDQRLGRLKTTSVPPRGFDEINNCQSELFSFGGRSFSIWGGDGELIYDSGDDFEQITATAFPDNFNSQDNRDTFDDRSDDKGPEPEGITTGMVNGRTYAFTIVERIGGVMVYDVSEPAAPRFQQYINNRDFAKGLGDRAPEGIVFIPAGDVKGFLPLIAVAHEESGTTTLYRIKPKTKHRSHIFADY